MGYGRTNNQAALGALWTRRVLWVSQSARERAGSDVGTVIQDNAALGEGTQGVFSALGTLRRSAVRITEPETAGYALVIDTSQAGATSLAHVHASEVIIEGRWLASVSFGQEPFGRCT